jgi:hypothetical protein
MINIISLLLKGSIGNISYVDLNNRQCWWIKQPQAVSRQRIHPTLILGNLFIFKRTALLYLGAWVGSQRKRPHCATPLSGVGLRLPNPPLIFLDKGIFLMIYSFLIAPKGSLLSTLSNPQIIRIQCESVKSAEVVLNGMPAALISRIPAGRAF